MQGQIQVKIRIDRLVVSEFVGGGEAGKGELWAAACLQADCRLWFVKDSAKGSESVDSSPIWADQLKVGEAQKRVKLGEVGGPLTTSSVGWILLTEKRLRSCWPKYWRVGMTQAGRLNALLVEIVVRLNSLVNGKIVKKKIKKILNWHKNAHRA